MSATESPKESTLNPPAGSMELEKLRALVADDGFAATFQTMGRYRTALLQVASALARSPAPNAEAVVTDHSVEANKMVDMSEGARSDQAKLRATLMRLALACNARGYDQIGNSHGQKFWYQLRDEAHAAVDMLDEYGIAEPHQGATRAADQAVQRPAPETA
ncbi:hypothetical protein [Ralstonia wenshanensis]|uniref:hypothetical protein n=1 Tax=Ralstonia wenshanensis TaxID=2842456 RepID=UPI002AAEA8FB|nr:hypothetical protein [Ralstonia wenshanensis]MDY7507215.1 hypothetical protein [Ralstonia wenshanensis]